MYDEKATRKNIVELFRDELAEKVAEDDAVFVFWAGHGTQQESSRFGELGYLIPYDGSWKKHSSNLSMETLKSEISKSLKARHVFYVMDACYGGLMADKRNINQKTLRDLKALQQIAKEDVRQVLTAGSKGEQVLDGTNGHSVFTWRLIEALEAAGDFITANEIQAIITRNVASDALKSDLKQTRCTANSTVRGILFLSHQKNTSWPRNRRRWTASANRSSRPAGITTESENRWPMTRLLWPPL
ncbi:MAG: caspase family protein [Deltaproteobacteria bacterium]|nr:caspase family protein [Deltaproteobacteria bacterium]